MELYVARHGETEFNVERRLQGSGQDSPLTPNGIEQAKALGNALEGITFDAVYSSPIKRATDTVSLAFGDKYKPILDPRLVEVGLGKAEGMLIEDILEIYGNAATSLFNDPVNYTPPPQGEPLTTMIERISAFLDDLAKTSHKRVFVLTHGYSLRVFQACVMDKTVAAIGNTRAYNNCEVVHYLYTQDKWEAKHA